MSTQAKFVFGLVKLVVQSWLYKGGFECELSSWPDNSVGSGVWMEFSGRGFKYHSGQLSIATSKNRSVKNTMYISSFRYIHVITLTILRLNKRGEATKPIAEMKYDTEQNMKLEYLYICINQ